MDGEGAKYSSIFLYVVRTFFFIRFSVKKKRGRSCACVGRCLSLIASARAGVRVFVGVPVAPMPCQVILEPGIGQFREFESPRVHSGINSRGLLLVAEIDLRKARERELTTLDEKSTSSGIAEPYASQKLKARTGGGKGTTPVTTSCPEAGK